MGRVAAWMLFTTSADDTMLFDAVAGVVHCDIKPANVLLRSSNIDFRGFTAKVRKLIIGSPDFRSKRMP